MFVLLFIEGVFTDCIICWLGNATEVQPVVEAVSKLLTALPSMESVNKDRLVKKANNIICYYTQPLASAFKLLPSKLG